MKKFVALLLALLLSFSFAVPSFASEISGSVTVTNFPSYFTGAYDNSISAELIAIHNYLDMYLGDIWLYTDRIDDNVQLIYENSLMFFNASVEQMQIELQFYNYMMNMIGNVNAFCSSIDNLLRTDLVPDMNSGFSSVTGAVNGTTSAVNSFKSTFQSFWNDAWFYEFQQDEVKGTVAYRLKMLQEVLADEKDLEMKQAAESATDGVFENFVKGQGSVNGSDIGSVLTLSNWFQNFFGGDSGTNAGSYIGTGVSSLQNTLSDSSDSGVFAWFTQTNADAIDAVPSSYSRNIDPATNPVIVTHYYDDKLSELENIKEMFGFG